MVEEAIRDKLIAMGKERFYAKKKDESFSGDPAADRLLNDLTNTPHAFVLACIMNRQIKAERAWLIPYKFSESLGDFSIATLAKLSRRDVKRLMTKPKALHRLTGKMSKAFHSGIQRIVREYEGDASRIWRGKPSSALIVYRFLEFDGVGPKIANMAAKILARDFKVEMADRYSIDIAADTHVRRVFGRLGLCEEDPDPNQVIYKARALHPEFPGILDSPCWHIGKEWCRKRKPLCSKCDIHELCPTASACRI